MKWQWFGSRRMPPADRQSRPISTCSAATLPANARQWFGNRGRATGRLERASRLPSPAYRRGSSGWGSTFGQRSTQAALPSTFAQGLLRHRAGPARDRDPAGVLTPPGMSGELLPLEPGTPEEHRRRHEHGFRLHDHRPGVRTTAAGGPLEQLGQSQATRRWSRHLVGSDPTRRRSRHCDDPLGPGSPVQPLCTRSQGAWNTQSQGSLAKSEAPRWQGGGPGWESHPGPARPIGSSARRWGHSHKGNSKASCLQCRGQRSFPDRSRTPRRSRASEA
jgi:hypothetical protein